MRLVERRGSGQRCEAARDNSAPGSMVGAALKVLVHVLRGGCAQLGLRYLS